MAQIAVDDSTCIPSGDVLDDLNDLSGPSDDVCTVGRCPITDVVYQRRQPATINVPWPTEINLKQGSPDFLRGIAVYHDFDWRTVFRHGRAQFRNGKRLAELANRECPDGKRPSLLLTEWEEVVAAKHETDLHFTLIVNIHKYLDFTGADVAVDFFVTRLQSRVTCLSDVEDNQVLQLAQSDPARMEELKQIIRRAKGEPSSTGSATEEDVVEVLRRIESIDGSLVETVFRLFLDRGIEAEFLLTKLLQGNDVEDLSAIIEWMLHGDASDVIRHIRRLNVDNLQKLNALAGACRLKEALAIWQTNTENSSEEFWQKKLEENAYILSYVFSFPVVLLKGKAYVGGKGFDNTGGMVVDFLLKNEMTSNVALVEIKTPTAALLATTPYRNDIFSVTSEVIGAVQQVRNDKDTLTKEYHQIVNSGSDRFQAFNPKCLVVVGNGKELADPSRIKSFELFRGGLNDVQVITFDELFRKVETLVSLLENG
jgi:hypothetical protein